MNIFVLDRDPRKAAQYHCDKHVIKMILESAQMLSTAIRHYGCDAGYKATHINHPCNIWVRESLSNYNWLFQLACALNVEYMKRYNKTVNHKSFDVIATLPGPPNFPDIGFTPFALAMPEQYRSDDPVESYRNYYMAEKADICTWRNQKPDWWKL